MTDAPERITYMPPAKSPYEEPITGVKYIRADLVARKDAALLAAEELAKAAKRVGCQWDQDLNNLDWGEEFDARSEMAFALTAFRAAMEADQ